MLPFGPLDGDAWHLCIDMQRLFLEPGAWHCPAGLEILPAILRLSTHAPERSAFTRFITAERPDQAEGQWRHYYKHWRSVTRAVAGDDAMALHADLLPLAQPELVFDKLVHDAFGSAEFAAFIEQAAPSALVLSGIETEVCVLATALTAVDRGIRVVIAVDAVASSNRDSHAACLAHIYPRFDQQIELASVETVIDAWRPA
ncbi:MAG: cysteine hydrolase family protein [Kiloniellales bacterium]